MKILKIISWLLRILASIILLQTLYFKFTGHPESVELFTKLGVEPWGRIGTGVIELVAGILILIPATTFIGSFIGVGLMLGAIASHLTIIGIESNSDGGQLFSLAIIVFVSCALLVVLHRADGLKLYQTLASKYFGKSLKTFLIICLFTSTLNACKKNTDAPTTSINESIEKNSVLVNSGTFVSGPDKTVSGKAEVYKLDGKFSVKLTSFSTDNGPALHVFLSKEAIPATAYDLGSLKSTNGNQVYDIPVEPNFSEYKFISIHCVDYNHYFGSALIK
jgi:putative oxidoreductase